MPPSPVVFQTSRLYAREIMPEDADGVFMMSRSSSDLGYMYWEPMDEEMAFGFVKACLAQQLEQPRKCFTLALCLRSSDEFIGIVSLELTEDRLQASAGYMIAKSHRGRGYATEALKGLLAFGFLGPELHRITASCDEKNTASFRAMERAGMRREGHFIKAVRAQVNGRTGWRSTYIYAMLQKEFLMTLDDGCYSPSGT